VTEELAELLQGARDTNAELGLTGMLLYAEGSFFQVLEGQADVVDALYDKIERDKRHDQVTLVIREPIPKPCLRFHTHSSPSSMSVAIDDFGAGYSGLNMLADFQPGQIKIDMNLVRGIERHGPRQAIVRAVV